MEIKEENLTYLAGVQKEIMVKKQYLKRQMQYFQELIKDTNPELIYYIKTAENQRQKENTNNKEKKKSPKKEITSQQQQEKSENKIK